MSEVKQKLHFGRYDYAAFACFAAYALCSLVIPLSLVKMGESLNFPLDQGGLDDGGVLHLVRSVAVVITLMICGFLAGRYGKRYSMALSVLLMGVGILLCAFAPGYWFLLPCLLLAGFGEGICEGLATPFVEKLHPQAPERYVNIAHSFWSVGIGICVIVAGALLVYGISWRYVLGACGGLALLVALMFLWPENPVRRYPEEQEKSSCAAIFRYSLEIAVVPRFWVYCGMMFLGAGAEFCLTFWSASYIQLTFNVGEWVAGLGTGGIALGMFLGRTLVGYYAKKAYLKHILLFTGLATIPLSLCVVLLKVDTFDNENITLLLLGLILFLCGIGISSYWPTTQVYGVGKLKQLDSTMLFIYFSAMGIPGCGFFTWLFGVLGDHWGLSSAFMLIPGSLVLFCLVVFLEGWVFKSKDESASIER